MGVSALDDTNMGGVYTRYATQAENDTGCCYKRKEYLVLSRGEVGPWTRTMKETPEGARHCHGLAPQIERRKGAGHPIPSPKAKKFGNVRDA